MRIPLHLPQIVMGPEDALQRVQHHMAMSALTRGKGFRFPSKYGAPSRIERISQAYFGDENVED